MKCTTEYNYGEVKIGSVKAFVKDVVT